MDTHAECHLVLTQLEVCVPHFGNDTRGESESYGSDVVASLLRSCKHLIERTHLVCLRTSGLVHEEDASNTTTSFYVLV